MNQNLTYTLSLRDYFNKTMLGANANTQRLDGSMNKLGSTINRVGGFIAGAFAISKIIDFTRNVVLATAAAASFSNAVIASSRTEGEGAANLYFLNQQVDRLGLNLHAAQNGYKTFAGAVMGTNIQGSKSNKIFRQVSEATTVLGLSAEQTEGSFLALGQMLSKGTVQAEELRGQLAERIPGAFQIGARAMGMTTKQLGDAMKEGLIDSETFLVKFGDELERTFGSKLGSATNSVQANLNRMSTEWERLQVNIGNSNTGMINSITAFASEFVNKLNLIISTLNKVDSAFANFGNGKDLGFGFLEKTDYYANFLSGGLLSGGSKLQMEQLQRAIQSNYVVPSSRGKSDALGSEAGILRLRSNYSKSFANKEIGKLEYDRSLALMEQALTEIRGNKTLNDQTKGFGATDTKDPGQQIGSPIDVTGARPQNITINVNAPIVENLNIHSQTMEAGVKEGAAMTKKEFLELLNDANQIANR